jgi:hypothetical protein
MTVIHTRILQGFIENLKFDLERLEIVAIEIDEMRRTGTGECADRDLHIALEVRSFFNDAIRLAEHSLDTVDCKDVIHLLGGRVAQ